MADADGTATKTAGKRSIEDGNAVGYQEYLEGLDLEVSDCEVRLPFLPPISDARPELNPSTVPQSPLEDRLDRSSDVSRYPGVAVLGQDFAELRKPVWVSGRSGATGDGFQLPVSKYVLRFNNQ